jgi:GDPmannose 4,6-dehydratase
MRVVNPDTHIALISDINSQDGSYLAEILIENGYEVCGISTSKYIINRLYNIDHMQNRLDLFYGDSFDSAFLNRTVRSILTKYKYLEKLHFYDFDHVDDIELSFDSPQETMKRNVNATHNLLEIIRNLHPSIQNKVKLFHASSCDIFGSTSCVLNEYSKINPCSPYGCSKAAAYHLVSFYRDTYNIKTSIGILFNHESPRQSCNTVTKKIINGFKQFKSDINNKLFPPRPIVLGNIECSRDWGHAVDYVYAMWSMMKNNENNEYLICSQTQSTIVDFIHIVADELGIDFVWVDASESEQTHAIDSKTGYRVITVSKKLYRDNEIMSKIGSSEKIFRELHWEPMMNINDVAKEMIHYM